MEWFADLAIRLGLPAGDFYRRLYATLPWWLLASAAYAALVVGGWRLIRERATSWVQAGARRAGSGRDAAALAVFCIALVVCFDGPGLVHGFFRQDDFSFLQVAREPAPLAHQVMLHHNDHPCPLYRVEVWTLLKVAGADATAGQLAAWFNAVTFATCVGMLLAGAWILHEVGASRLALWAFCFVSWIWPGWGEFTAGFYTLGLYLQVLALGLGAVAASLRGFRLNSPRWLGTSLLLAGLAVGLNISGVGVFAALGAFTLAGQWPLASPRGRTYAALLLLLAATACYVYLVAFQHPLSARELVQNPAGSNFAPALVDNLGQHWAGALLALPSGLGGTLLGLVVPTYLQLGANQVADQAAARWTFLAAEFLVLLLLGRWVALRLVRIDAPARAAFFGAVAAAMAGVLLVIVARTAYAIRVPGTLWHAKYLVGPVVWLVLAGALLADRLWFSAPAMPPRLATGIFAVVALGLGLIASHQVWERTLLPMPLAYSARGRWGNAENAMLRRQQYEAVMQDLQALARTAGATPLALPEPAWGRTFFERYPLLEWGSDHTPRGVTHLFADMAAASPNLRLWVEWRPVASFTPDEQQRFTAYAWLQPAATQTFPSP